MTAADNIAIAPRTGKAFKFTRKRANVADAEFFPGSGTRLKFEANATDTLSLASLPPGLLQAGDSVTVEYNNAVVFKGTVATVRDVCGRGDDRVESVTVEGPWGLMARMAYRQLWTVAGTGGATATHSLSRLVLNRSLAGAAIDMSQQITDILNFADDACGFTVGTVSAGSQILPAEEVTNITCAAAVVRTLRFFPKIVCRFNYATTPKPTLDVLTPSESQAAYIAAIPKTQRSYTRTAHPIVGVDIATCGHDIQTGDSSTDAALRTATHQTAGDTTSLDTLHLFIPLEGGSASTTWETLDVTVDSNANFSSLVWWMQKHPALKDVTSEEIKAFGPFSRSGGTYPNVTETPVGDLRRFGLGAEVERMAMPMTIEKNGRKENVVLTMDVITTNATTRSYTRQTGSSSVAAETLPEGLAAAILAQRGGSLTAEDMHVRLRADFPKIGDAVVEGTGADAETLYLQLIEVDCEDLTAELHFGRPAYLSPEDMRDLMNGFRQRAFASNVPTPNDAEDDAEDAQDIDGVQPISSACQVVGTIEKTTVSSSSGTRSAAGKSVVIDTTGSAAKVEISGGGGEIKLDASDVDSGKEAKIRELTITTGGKEKKVKVLATDPESSTEPDIDDPDNDPDDEDWTDPDETPEPDVGPWPPEDWEPVDNNSLSIGVNDVSDDSGGVANNGGYCNSASGDGGGGGGGGGGGEDQGNGISTTPCGN